MYRVFNCGIGMIICVSPEHLEIALTQLQQAGETVFHIGQIEAHSGQPIILENS
jgi:phosphoribosylformylglycinamidine cyclo-ligase